MKSSSSENRDRRRVAKRRSAGMPQNQPQSSSNGAIPAPELIQTEQGLARMVEHLRKEKLFAIDTEGNSYFRYYPRVCLIQITAYANSSQGSPSDVVDYLVDPLCIKDLSALGDVLADPSIEVIGHALENDIITIQRDFGFRFTHVFDTQLAARILGWRKYGLGSILEEHFGVLSDKRMQLTDWGRRPLTPKQMLYAQLDTHYLPALRARQIQELKQAKRWKEAQEAFAALENVSYVEKQRDESSFWQMKYVREVPREDTGLLLELWLWREQIAQQMDRPPFKILNDRALVDITLRKPQDLHELAAIHGVSKRQLDRFGRDILAAIRRGQSRPLPELPEYEPRLDLRLEEPIRSRYHALRRWRTETANARGVDPDIVFSNEVLLKIAKEAPRQMEELKAIPAVGPWKAATYGQDILRILTKSRNK